MGDQTVYILHCNGGNHSTIKISKIIDEVQNKRKQDPNASEQSKIISKIIDTVAEIQNKRQNDSNPAELSNDSHLQILLKQKDEEIKMQSNVIESQLNVIKNCQKESEQSVETLACITKRFEDCHRKL